MKRTLIEMNPFKDEPQDLKKLQLKQCEEVINSGWYVLGKNVLEFEKKWAKDCGARFGVGVASGLDALEIGLRSLKISEGDEIITTSMTAFATTLAIMKVGAKPVFADIDPSTALIDIEEVSKLINKNTKAIILVHLYGRINEMDEWIKISKLNNIFLIEDCAQSHLAEYKNKVSGNFGDFSSFSFYPTKNLGALGDAGMLITNNEEIFNSAKFMRNYGQVNRYEHDYIGLNSRLDEIQAAILIERRKRLVEFTERRQKIAKIYNEQIKNPDIKILALPKSIKSHVYYLFVINCHKRDKLQSYLYENNIQTLIHYPIPCHRQKAMKNVAYEFKNLKNTEMHADTCISLPCNPIISNEEAEYIAEKLNKFKG